MRKTPKDEKRVFIKGYEIVLRRNQTLAMKFYSYSKDGKWEEKNRENGARKDLSYIENQFVREMNELNNSGNDPLQSWTIDLDNDLYMVIVKIKPGTKKTNFYLEKGFIPVTPEQLS